MKALKGALLVAAGVAVTIGLQVAAGSGTAALRAQAATPQAPQESQTVPSPTPTFVPGPAAVNVLNQPTVNAKQDGEWTVRLTQAPVLQVAPVQVSTPAFIHAGGKYAFTWAPGAKPDIRTVLAVGRDGWVLVSGASNQPGSTWLNPARAMEIEQVE